MLTPRFQGAEIRIVDRVLRDGGALQAGNNSGGGKGFIPRTDVETLRRRAEVNPIP